MYQRRVRGLMVETIDHGGACDLSSATAAVRRAASAFAAHHDPLQGLARRAGQVSAATRSRIKELRSVEHAARERLRHGGHA